jgi:hypothetical protein
MNDELRIRKSGRSQTQRHEDTKEFVEEDVPRLVEKGVAVPPSGQ